MKKRIDYLGGHAWGHVFMACSKLEAMAIYLVKQASSALEVCNLVTNKKDVRVFRRFRSFQIHLRFCLATV
jgi:hypothetical protein